MSSLEHLYLLFSQLEVAILDGNDAVLKAEWIIALELSHSPQVTVHESNFRLALVHEFLLELRIGM